MHLVWQEHNSFLNKIEQQAAFLLYHSRQSYWEVVSMDLSFERLLVLRERAVSEGLNNITCVHGGDTGRLPFVDGTFDIVCLNGVLEWLGSSCPSDPGAVQLNALREIRRVLRDDGQIYIGIENRFGFRYFLGRPEEHCDLRYASLLPRAVANWYCQYRKGHPYHTHTYSFSALRQLLSQSGLGSVAVWWPYPDYREFNALYELTNPASLDQSYRPKKWWKRLIKSALVRTGTFARLAPSFGAVASPCPHAPSFLGRLVNATAESLGERWSLLDVLVRRARHSRQVHVTVAEGNGKTPAAIFKIPLDPPSQGQLRSGTARCEEARRWLPGCELLPRTLKAGSFEGQAFSVEAYIPGVNGDTLVRPGRNEGELYGRACDFLVQLIAATKYQAPASRENIVRWALGQEASGTAAVGPQTPAPWGWAVDRITGLIGGRLLPFCHSHGDYHLGNLRFDKALNLTGVLDWDWSVPCARPLDDVLSFLLDSWVNLHDRPLGEALRSLGRRELRPAEEEMVLACERAFGLSPDDFEASFLALLVRQAFNAVRFRDPSAEDYAGYLQDLAAEDGARRTRPLAVGEGR